MLWINDEEMVESVDDLKSSCSVRGIRLPDFEVLDAKIASALNRITIIPASRERSVWRKRKRKADRLLDLRVLPGHWDP